ncbi:MAG: ATP-binding cassette domain-containing protein [Rhodospirillales bacterium]|nr:ATP-binding cassette domain-containing protein [Rhodospirillales bacterium]
MTAPMSDMEQTPTQGTVGPSGVFSGSPFAVPPGAAQVEEGAEAGREYDDSGVLSGIGEGNDLSASLLALLEALDWRGEPQEVAEALPHFVENFDITSFRNVLAALGYESRAISTSLKDIGLDHTPSLFLPDDGTALVLVALVEPAPDDEEGGEDADEQYFIEAFDSAAGRYGPLPAGNPKGTAYVFTPATGGLGINSDAGDDADWFRAVAGRFKGLGFQALGITFLLTLLGLAVPLFVMAVFDQAAASGSAELMTYLAIGVGIAVAGEIVLRSLRSGIFAFIAARLDNIVGVEVFRKILALPASLIERAAVGAQIARIRDFETMRRFFTGSAALVLFELPFSLIFVAAVAYLGGAIALIPLVILVLSASLGLWVMPKTARLAAQASDAGRRKQELTVETLAGMRALKYCGADTTWLKRYRSLSGTSALQHFYSAQFASLLETWSYVATIAAGFATVAFGVAKVQAGVMSPGALAACLFLVWRAMEPLKAGLTALAKMNDVESGVAHLNDLMDIEDRLEARPAGPSKAHAGYPVAGRITFENVSIHYEPDAPAALEDASFDIKSGKIVAILGSNGAGKTTLLKLIAGLYQADEGSVRIDGRDVRDMDPAELRRAVSYVPQVPQFFYGTIAQNLRLANPTATDDDLRRAVRQAGALEDVEAMEQGAGDWKRTGLDVRLGDGGAGQVSPGLLQRLNLARGYLKKSPIVLLDEPGNGLDIKGDKALMQALSNMRGETTVFIVTHRPSHLKMADRIVWMEYGAIRSVGRPKVVMQKTKGKVL